MSKRMPVVLDHINLMAIIGYREYWRGNQAYDVRKIGFSLENGQFELNGFDDSGVEYFDSGKNRGIFSIGQEEETGKIVASFSGEFYQRPGWKCLWLR